MMTRSIQMLASLSVAAAALMAGTFAALAGEASAIPLTAGKGLPLDVGNKHTMTYYQEQNGACAVTVVIASLEGGVKGDDSPGTRVTASVMPGTALRIDSSTSKSAEFFCGPAGQKMNARVFDREGYSKDRKS